MLMFSIWFDQGIVHKYNEDWKISFTDFMKEATSPESIRRARQEIQSENPELQPTDPKVIKARKFKKDNYEETVINAMF